MTIERQINVGKQLCFLTFLIFKKWKLFSSHLININVFFNDNEILLSLSLFPRKKNDDKKKIIVVDN